MMSGSRCDVRPRRIAQLRRLVMSLRTLTFTLQWQHGNAGLRCANPAYSVCSAFYAGACKIFRHLYGIGAVAHSAGLTPDRVQHTLPGFTANLPC